MAKVLVIEDEPAIRDTLVEILESEGYAVSSAEHGAAGLAAARAHHPHLILLDLMMPVMDGWTFLAVQLEDASIADIPVVILSAVRDFEAIHVAQCLSKPCSIDDLLGAVERYRRRGDDLSPASA